MSIKNENIAIIDGNDFALSTEEIIDWLDYNKKSWKRIKGFDFLFEKRTKTNEYDISQCKVVWFRTVVRNTNVSEFLFNQIVLDKKLVSEIKSSVLNELNVFRSYYLRQFNQIKSYPNISTKDFDKIYVLEKAKDAGLDVPEYKITNNKEEVIGLSNGRKLISKPLFEIPSFVSKNQLLTYRTELIEVNELSDFFFPSLFQVYIEKEYELRVFFMDNTFFSMVIFSQRNSKTKVDFRNYDDEIPNRCCPYKLPSSLTKRLKKLIKTLNYNTGSIDILKGSDGKYYFLEINLTGQFGWLSKNCNYYLEKFIAERL